MIVEKGIKGLDSDGMQIAPMNPWVHAYSASTGKNALGIEINAGQQITPGRGPPSLHLGERMVQTLGWDRRLRVPCGLGVGHPAP